MSQKNLDRDCTGKSAPPSKYDAQFGCKKRTDIQDVLVLEPWQTTASVALKARKKTWMVSNAGQIIGTKLDRGRTVSLLKLQSTTLYMIVIGLTGYYIRSTFAGPIINGTMANTSVGAFDNLISDKLFNSFIFFKLLHR